MVPEKRGHSKLYFCCGAAHVEYNHCPLVRPFVYSVQFPGKFFVCLFIFNQLYNLQYQTSLKYFLIYVILHR